MFIYILFEVWFYGIYVFVMIEDVIKFCLYLIFVGVFRVWNVFNVYSLCLV